MDLISLHGQEWRPFNADDGPRWLEHILPPYAVFAIEASRQQISSQEGMRHLAEELFSHFDFQPSRLCHTHLQLINQLFEALQAEGVGINAWQSKIDQLDSEQALADHRYACDCCYQAWQDLPDIQETLHMLTVALRESPIEHHDQMLSHYSQGLLGQGFAQRN